MVGVAAWCSDGVPDGDVLDDPLGLSLGLLLPCSLSQHNKGVNVTAANEHARMPWS
jgi:hypothetical protein